MSVFAQSTTKSAQRLFSRGLTGVAGVALAAVLATALAVGLASHPPPSLRLTIGAGLAGLGVLVLALVRYTAAVAVGMLIFGVVFIEPAPPDVLLMIVILVALLTGRFSLRGVPFPMLVLVGLFLVLNLLSAVFATYPGRALFFFSVTAYLCAFSVWLSSYVVSTRRARMILRPLLAGAAGSTAIGVAVLFVVFPGSPLMNFSDGQRARGFFKDPNVFGPFCVLLALLVISELLEPRLLKGRRTTKVALLLVFSLGIIFAFSRAAWLNAAVGLLILIVVYALRRGGSRKVAAILMALVVATAVGSITLASTGSIGFLRQRAHLQSYDIHRFSGQEQGVELILNHPLGIGPGQFEQTVGIAAHSTYVRALAEQGALGLATMLGLMLGTLGLATQNAILGRDTFGIGSAPLLAAWCGLLANSAFVDTLHWRHFWLVAGLVWAGAMRADYQAARAP